MKNLFAIILSSSLILSSCYVTRYTHAQVMDNAVKGKSKAQIIELLGLPDQKKTQGNYEEWYYDQGSGTVAMALPAYNGNYYSHPSTMVSKNYNNYIKLTFSGEKVINWDTSGIDYTQKEISIGRTALGTVFWSGVTIGALYLLYLLSGSP